MKRATLLLVMLGLAATQARADESPARLLAAAELLLSADHFTEAEAFFDQTWKPEDVVKVG